MGDGVAARIKTGTHLQQLDSTEAPRSRLQRSGSETGYGLGMPTRPYGRPPFVFYTLLPLVIKLFPY